MTTCSDLSPGISEGWRPVGRSGTGGGPGHARWRALAAVAVAALATLAGCAAVETRNPVPLPLTDAATPVGFGEVRMWGDFNDPARIEAMMLGRAAVLRERFAGPVAAGETPRLKFLAISGGGQYGAFAAGVLTAWTEAGTRPVFDVVTGISTGSIIAPFAFLGPGYDHVLEDVYTTTSTEEMLESTILSGLLGGSALADTSGLRAKIAEHVTPGLLAEVAAEHRKGRLLFVGTTNIDVGRSVIWNMGAIAASGQPGALELFRSVILASAAIPIAFPPVFFDVEAQGARYREMHVDGGVTSQVTILSPQVPNYLMERLVGFELDRELFVVVNGPVTPPPKVVAPRVLDIAGAALETLWYAQAVGDLYRIHAIAERDRVTPRYAWIPADFTEQPAEEFDPVFMGKLFRLGQELLRDGLLWQEVPPSFTAIGSTAVERGERDLPRVGG